MIFQMQIATPISHLFEDAINAELIQKYSDCLECRDRSIKSILPKQKVFHCQIQPIHKLTEDELNYLTVIKKMKHDLELISFHMGSCYKDPKIQNGRFIPYGEKISIDMLIENSIINFKKIKNIFNNGIELAIENNNYFPTEAYDFIADSDFISEITKLNKINFLYDISHAKITSYYKNIEYQKYYSELPIDKIIQVHVSRHGFNNKNEMIDAHEIPGNEELMEIKELIKKKKLNI